MRSGRPGWRVDVKRQAGELLGEPDDDLVDWDEVADLVEDACRLVAPKCLVARLDRS